MKVSCALLLLAVPLPVQEAEPLDFAALVRIPADFASVQVAPGKVVLSGSRWGFLATPGEHAHASLDVTVTIEEPARRFDFFGRSWSVWPDLSFPDQGWEAALLVRSGRGGEYRIQLSYSLQEVTLVKARDGGFLRSVPCAIRLREPHRLSVEARGNRISVRVDGDEKIVFQDDFLPVTAGRFGVGVSSGAKVAFERAVLRALSPPASAAPPKNHVPDFSARKWLGGRPWVFDGAEPILMLPTEEETYINSVKLRPGFKPLLSWNSHWDISNQGAYPEGKVRGGPVTVSGGGAALTASWKADHVRGRFVQRMKMVVGWDPRRSTYTYDVDSELEVLPGEPFHFRYGYDFEHHTPLDPFRWQYLIVKREGGRIARRPLYPVDPGVMDQVEPKGGARVWYGRHFETMHIAPAVEYDIPEPGKRTVSTAVCAAFYDTGVAFGPETAAPGTKVRVRYRYTGWTAEEAEALFRASRVYETPTLDPEHHYIFADEGLKQTFGRFVPMSEPWTYGRRPYMTGHNRRPTYALEKNIGVGSGFAMKLGPGAYGAADLPVDPLPPGRYAVTALCKGVNLHGPGGRIEVASKDKDGKVVRRETHFVGNGSWDWKRIGFVTEVPGSGPILSLGFGNGGTGEVLFTDVEIARADGAAAASYPAACGRPPAAEPVPAGALADYRMAEGSGYHVFDAAGGPFGMLELANVRWVTDEGRPALEFADPAAGRRDVPRMGNLELHYFRGSNWSGTPVALAGYHGGGFELRALTVAAWIRPAARMGRGQHGGSGDVVGVGARRFILRLLGHEAPYRLQVAVNVRDRLESFVPVAADRWVQVAMTGEAEHSGRWKLRLFLDGKPVGEGRTEHFVGPASLPPSIILGSELFYLHDSWFRGRIGRVVVLDRAVAEEGLGALGR
jgi:hypothetical protein